MKLFLVAAFFLLPLTLLAQNSDSDFINKTLYPATALLYSQDESGDMAMRCSATAIDYKDGETYFLTASHCVSADNTDDKKAEIEDTFFYISPDNPGRKEFFKAEVIAAGYQHRGDDFALIKIKCDYKFPVVDVGTDSTTFGDKIVNVAAPIGLGRQILFGSISNPNLDRPLVDKDQEINWTNAVILQLPNTYGGSSGSSVVCLSQHAICAVLVGSVAKSAVIAIPIDRFKTFREQVEKGTYKFYKKSEDK